MVAGFHLETGELYRSLRELIIADFFPSPVAKLPLILPGSQKDIVPKISTLLAL